MTYRVCYWDEIERCQKERDTTPEETAEIDARKAAPPTAAPAPTKEELLAQLQAIQAQIQAL
jgi:hypothetical protein